MRLDRMDLKLLNAVQFEDRPASDARIDENDVTLKRLMRKGDSVALRRG